MSERAPALSDVAARAGVSHQTVSRVLNNHPHVAAATRAKVTAAMADLNYRRNMTARSLATGRPDAIGAIAPQTSLYGPSTMVTALGTAATARSMTLSIEYVADFGAAAVGAAVDRLLGHGIAGLLLILPVEAVAEAAAHVVNAAVPIVTVDGSLNGSCSSVAVDQVAGARLATQHLLDAGADTVWHVAGPSDWNDSRGREAGWRSVLQAAGAEEPPVLRGDWSAASGYEAGQVLARVEDCRAVFVANDHMALGVARALHERGRRVPEDTLLVGFDDVPQAAYFTPPLTTVNQDFEAVGRTSLDLLLDPRTGEDGALPGPRAVLIPPVLVARESSRTT